MRLTLLSSLLGLLCTGHVLADDGLPALHARFELRGHGQVEHLELVRDGARIEYRFLERGYSELWQRDAQGDLEHVRSFPRDKKSVHYTPGDLRTIGLTADWSSLQSLLTSEERTSLARAGAARSVLGRAASSLRGTLRGQPSRVLWLEGEALPAQLTLGQGKAKVVITLLALGDCEADACAAQSTEDVRALEFADLGDMEYDPFVRRYLAHDALSRGPSVVGAGHTH